ncbi:MAG: hypothetical protein ACXW50_19615, partial [Candidatus Binatia bacterium]
MIAIVLRLDPDRDELKTSLGSKWDGMILGSIRCSSAASQSFWLLDESCLANNAAADAAVICPP